MDLADLIRLIHRIRVLKAQKTMSNYLSVDQLRRRIGSYDRQQILLWQRMTPVERLEIAFQAYLFALEAVRMTEYQRHPDLSEEEFRWRVIRRMQGNQQLGREKDVRPSHLSRVE